MLWAAFTLSCGDEADDSAVLGWGFLAGSSAETREIGLDNRNREPIAAIGEQIKTRIVVNLSSVWVRGGEVETKPAIHRIGHDKANTGPPCISGESRPNAISQAFRRVEHPVLTSITGVADHERPTRVDGGGAIVTSWQEIAAPAPTEAATRSSAMNGQQQGDRLTKRPGQGLGPPRTRSERIGP